MQFHWQRSLLGTFAACTAYHPRDGGETSRIKYQDGKLYWRLGPNDWFHIADVQLITNDCDKFTELEYDLLSSVLGSLGYFPGNDEYL